jgi:hypothetical protein
LYVVTRSEFWDRSVQNPTGLFYPYLSQHMDNVGLLLARAGWRWLALQGIELEAGLKLFLPISPFSAPHFSYYEKGGSLEADGSVYGGMPLQRVVSAYLHGSY